MGTKYTTQAASGYNAAPPPDDGSQVAANLVQWSMVKTKLADPIKTLADAENSALVTTLDLSARAISVNDTAIASDHWKTLQVTNSPTIQLSSAATVGSGYEVGIFNAGTGTVTITPAGSDTINGASASVTLFPKGSMIFRSNQALTGYNVVAQNGQVATLTATTSVITPTVKSPTGSDLTFGTTDLGSAWSIANVAGLNLLPSQDVTSNLGSASFRIKTVFTPNVQFPATQVTSADANCLDDYEENSWTPSIGGSATYTTQSGRYTTIGNLVLITGILNINSIGTGSTTVISGLPFPNVDAIASQISIRVETGSATAIVSATAQVDLSASTITISSRTAANAADGANAIFANGCQVRFSGCYRKA